MQGGLVQALTRVHAALLQQPGQEHAQGLVQDAVEAGDRLSYALQHSSLLAPIAARAGRVREFLKVSCWL